MALSAVQKSDVLADLRSRYGTTISRVQLIAYRTETGVNARFVRTSCPQVGRGLYSLDGSTAPVVAPKAPKAPKAPRLMKARLAPPVGAVETAAPVVAASAAVSSSDEPSLSFTWHEQQSKAEILARIEALTREASALISIPEKSPAFVPFGDFDVVRTIVASKLFHPVFITGLSGNGKTFQIEQACALEQREYLRLNVNLETDEDDLLGGFRLISGETRFELGPVVIAALRGAVLCIDEIDLSSAKILCLQALLEGNPIVIKKLGVTIHPKPGFSVFATANTKGRGSADGKFVGTNLLNEAFLERFPITIEQAYPSVDVEKKILVKTFQSLGGVSTPETTAFFTRLAKWADAIRATYFDEEGIDDLISTRRLVHIVKTFAIFKNEARSVALCLHRFDAQTQATFLDLWAKLTPEPVTVAAPAPVTEAADPLSDVITDF